MQMQPTLSYISMDNRREKNNSGESFSFPSTPNDQDSDFEFGSLTPDSPSSDPCRSSPADHLFFNGRLLPHSFPFQQHPTVIYDNFRSTSRTSSIRSKDSLISSRSNSTNSRSSSCSSARTSSSDSSERKLFYNRVSSGKASMVRDRYQVNKMGSAQAYGCSQRWQYITPVPALNRDPSRRRKGEQARKEEMKPKKQTKRESWQFGRRLFRWFVMACKECHAMEPSSKETIVQENVKLR